MNHFMLPKPNEHQSSDAWGVESTRYGSFAMEQLINGILQRGGMKHRLEVKLFGAGRIYEGNIEWVLHYLKNEGFGVAKSDLGDVVPSKVYYFTESGRVLMKKIERVKNTTIIDREAECSRHLKQEGQEQSDITLF